MNGAQYREAKQLNEHRKPVIWLGDNMRRLNKLSIIVCHTHSQEGEKKISKSSTQMNRKKNNE